MADASKDGSVDLVSAPNNNNANKLWLNDGSGNFAKRARRPVRHASFLGDARRPRRRQRHRPRNDLRQPGNKAVWVSDAGNSHNLTAPTPLPATIVSPNVYRLQWDVTPGGDTPVEGLTFDIKAEFSNGATHTLISGKAPEREGVIGHGIRTGNRFEWTMTTPPVSGSGILAWAVRAVDAQFFRTPGRLRTPPTYADGLQPRRHRPGTLRDCIIYANAHPGTTITFNNTLMANQTISLALATGALPAITAADTTIDGGTANVTLDKGACSNCTGLTISASRAAIKSLTIKNFDINGILITTGSGSVIGGPNLSDRNYIISNGDDVSVNTKAGIFIATPPGTSPSRTTI